MVCLNQNISFDKLKLKSNISQELINEINYAFDLDDRPNQIKLENNINLGLIKTIIGKVNKIVKKKVDDLFSSDYFIYKNMNDNLCTYKIKKGKKADNFCCKKITKNGNKLKYVCTKHNPEHIPRKRNTKDKQLNIITNISGESRRTNKSSILGIKRNNKRRINKIIKPKKIVIRGIINFETILNKLLN